MKITDKITITCEDNMALMARYPDNYFDLAIVDPPYGINAPKKSATPAQRKKGATRLNGGSGKLKNRMLNISNINWDNEIPNEEYFKELFRVSKNQIIWGGNYFPLPPTRCIVCWDKCQPWENFSQIELAWTSFDMPAQIFKFDNRTGGKIHPTQKPIELYKYLTDKYASDSFKILDTHLGGGSIAIACHDYGFELTACELDPDYYEKAVERIKNHVSQLKMF